MVKTWPDYYQPNSLGHENPLKLKGTSGIVLQKTDDTLTRYMRAQDLKKSRNIFGYISCQMGVTLYNKSLTTMLREIRAQHLNVY